MNYRDVCPGCPDIQQDFGCTDYAYEWYSPGCPPPHRFHDGVDFGNNAGGHCGTPLLACGDGTVLAIGETWPGSDGLGPQSILLQLEDGKFAGYGHGTAEVAVGQRVAKGQRIGAVDTLGNSSGCHLHLLIGSSYGPVPMGDVDPLGYDGPSASVASATTTEEGMFIIFGPQGAALCAGGYFKGLSQEEYDRLTQIQGMTVNSVDQRGFDVVRAACLHGETSESADH